MPSSPARRLLLALPLLLVAPGCFSARYLAQAARGQLALVQAARPLDEVLADPETPERTRALLAQVRAIKAFGVTQGLTPTQSYERYADLHRPAAAWIVQACGPLELEPRRWRFPVVGSVPYLGFFDSGSASEYAARLGAEEGLDTDVRTASAYSTLGWFRDPVLSTMLRGGDEALGALADVVLHESVHATLYVKDQSTFNESLASFVADRLAPAWLDAARGPGSPERAAWDAARAREARYLARMRALRADLQRLYASDASADVKRVEKARLAAAAQADLGLARAPNNAVLAGLGTYDGGLAAFERMFRACDGSVPRFLAAAAAVRPDDFERPQQADLDGVIARLARRCLVGQRVAAKGARGKG